MTGISGGLLGDALRNYRKCLRCDSAMDKLPGLWGIDQVAPNPAAQGIVKTNTVFIAGLYVCKKCGCTELADEDLAK